MQHLLLVVFGCRAPEAPVFDEPPSLLPLPECPEGRELFRADTVHRLDLALAPEAWQGLVEEARNTPEYDGPPMTWRTATLSWNGTPLAAPVQVRPKGHFSRITAVGEAFPLKLDFDELDAGQELDGLRKLNLHPMGEELSVLRERLSYGALREAGLPTARTALVELSVNGTALGTYNAVEHLRGDFVRCHFPEPYGDLYKPEEAVGSLAFLGDQIEDYPVANHKWPDETDHQAFLRLVATLDEGELLDIDEVLDVDRTLAYLAANVAVGSFDYYPTFGHNYYLYEASPGRFVFLPWDMNLSQQPLWHPCGHGRNEEHFPVSHRLLGHPALAERYGEWLETFLDGPMHERVFLDALDAATQQLTLDRSAEELRESIQVRHDLLTEQLPLRGRCPVWTE